MADSFVLVAALWTFAASVTVAMIAILRPVMRRYCGAPAVLKLWWILPLGLAAVLVPKHAPPRWLAPPVLVQSMAMPVAKPLPSTREAVPWKEVTMFAWLVGALLTTAWLFLRQRQYMRTIAWGVGRRGALPPGAGPAVVGAIRPRLALPSDFRSRFSPLERRLIVLHETIHIRRRDGIANLGMSVLLATQWFNPALHWASRAMCRDQECACDALVISRHPHARRTYADALLKSLPDMQYLPLVCRWQAYHPTVQRIAMLNSHLVTRTRATLASTLLLAGGALASMLVYASGPAGNLPGDTGVSESKYRVGMVIYREGKVVARPVVVTKANKQFSIVVGSDTGSTPVYRYGINMVASPRSEGIAIEGEIEVGEDRAVVARPRLVVAAGKQSSIEYNPDGGRAMRLELVVDPISAVELEQMKNRGKQ